MNLTWDHQNLRLIGSIVNTRPVTSMTWVLRDKLPIKLYPVELDGVTYVTSDLPVGYEIRFGAKLPSALDVPVFLISCVDWTFVAATGGDPDHYVAVFDMTGEGLIGAIGSATSLLLRAEFVLYHTVSGSKIDSTQFDLTILKDVNN